MYNKTWSIEEVPINGPEDLRETIRGSDMEIVQLKPGKLQGSITHFRIGMLEISAGRFSANIRLRGSLHPERVALATLIDSAGRMTQWWQEVQIGDVGVHPAGVEFDAIHCGDAAYLVVSIALPELSSMLVGEDHLSDPAFWNTKRLYRTDPLIANKMPEQLMRMLPNVERKFAAPSDQDVDFLGRSIIETFAVALGGALPREKGRSFYTGARLVSETEDYANAASGRPVHIFELCSALKVSRRSLHRAFADTLGVGPVAYLRRRRLSAMRSVLKRCNPATISIGDLAFEYGFPEPGRCAAYYREHFGETPSETLRSRPVSTLGVN